ncbi:MAG: hypothetical protein GY811_23180 [Myxococcales bacterium]|nr:hypothetical protein [Myxococcales bacterium]
MAVVSCDKDSNKRRALGELVEVVEGKAARREAKSDWTPAAAGNRFFEGEALRTDDVGVARLRFAGELLRMGPDTTVFFGQKKLDFDGEIEVGEGLIELGIDFGDAEVTTTGRVRLTKRDDKMKFEVLVGQVTITDRGEVAVIEEGQGLAFEIGTGVLVRESDAPPDAGVADPAVPADAAVLTDAALDVAAVGVQAKVLGKGVRTRTDADQPWKRLRAGEHDLGSQAELEIKGRNAKVVLSRGADQVVLKGPGVAAVDVGAEEFVRVKRGTVAGRSSDGDVVIAVPSGTIRLHPGEHGSRAKIDVGRGGALTQVETGKATLRSGKDVETLLGGENATVTSRGIEVTDRAPTVAHMTLGTPKSATLHVAKKPTNVRISFSDHCARGVVEVSKSKNFRRARSHEGDGGAIVQLSSGANRYRVRCYSGDTLNKKPAATGRLSVRRDSGSRPLPKGAPSNSIDADGRRYTVLFQNRMPALTFRWPNAPASGGYVLHVQPREGRGKWRQESTAKAKKSFASGAFAEGVYEYWFTGGGKESKHSQLAISFDNAAATGYLSSPKASDSLSGSTVKVSGAAVAGWTVSVGGQELRLDRQFRFDQDVPVGPDGIAVRFSHPSYGVHYYLRSK